MTPLAGLVLLAVLREDDASPERASGIIVPHQAIHSTRLIGTVLGVGKGVVGLEWGDQVMMSRYQSVWFWKHPLPDFFGLWGAGQSITLTPDDGGPESYTIGQYHSLAIVRVEHLICRVASRQWVFHRMGEAPRPRPVGDRVMVRHRPLKERISDGGIVLPTYDLIRTPEQDEETGATAESWWARHHTDLIGQVVAVGNRVDDLMPGDWCLVPPDKGTTCTDGAGNLHSILGAEHIELRWDSEPEHPVTHYAPVPGPPDEAQGGEEGRELVLSQREEPRWV